MPLQIKIFRREFMKKYEEPKIREVVYPEWDILSQSNGETFGDDPYDWMDSVLGGKSND